MLQHFERRGELARGTVLTQGFRNGYTPSFLNFSNIPPLFVQPAEVLPPLRRVFVHFVENLGVDKFSTVWYNGRAPRAVGRGKLYHTPPQKSSDFFLHFTQFFPVPNPLFLCKCTIDFSGRVCFENLTNCTKAGQILCAICTLCNSKKMMYNYLCKRLGDPATKSEKVEKRA